MRLEDVFSQVLRRASVVMRQTQCTFMHEGHRCPSASSGECAICHAPFCVAHAMHAVTDNTDMVCLLCINEYAELVAKNGAPKRVQEQRAAKPAWEVRPGPAPRPAPTASPPSIDQESLRCAALAVLGLETGSSDEEIKAAFKQLAKKYHPDRFRNEEAKRKATKRFIEVKTAFEFLTKTDRRAA